MVSIKTMWLYLSRFYQASILQLSMWVFFSFTFFYLFILTLSLFVICGCCLKCQYQNNAVAGSLWSYVVNFFIYLIQKLIRVQRLCAAATLHGSKQSLTFNSFFCAFHLVLNELLALWAAVQWADSHRYSWLPLGQRKEKKKEWVGLVGLWGERSTSTGGINV